MGSVPLGALHNFSAFEIRLDTSTLTSCSTLIFTQYFLLMLGTSQTRLHKGITSPKGRQYYLTLKLWIPLS